MTIADMIAEEAVKETEKIWQQKLEKAEEEAEERVRKEAEWARKETEEQIRTETIFRLLDEGMPRKSIARVSGLTLEELQQTIEKSDR